MPSDSSGNSKNASPVRPGKGLNFFFSDELEFGVSGRLWSDGFAEEFRKCKGYDIVPELTTLFKDTGPRTPELRLDCYDVLAALSEEVFFKPVFDWHQQRGMILGCDHGGRGKRVDEFGDYFRIQRWNQGPGADQPGLGKDLIKAKVAASGEVRVNGQAAGILAAPPWKLDISAFTKPGENRTRGSGL